LEQCLKKLLMAVNDGPRLRPSAPGTANSPVNRYSVVEAAPDTLEILKTGAVPPNTASSGTFPVRAPKDVEPMGVMCRRRKERESYA
jgi:hypothetical protein